MIFTIAIGHRCDLPWNALSSRMMSTDYISSVRGWGRGLRRAIGNWYSDRHPKDATYPGREVPAEV